MHRLRQDSFYWLLGVSGALLIALGIKLWLLLAGVVPFNADEAVVALMARHILGGDMPIFFYGQAYMGSLDAILVAAAFRLLGSSVWAIRFIQIGLYLLTILTTALLSWKLSGVWKVGVITAIILAVPTINMTLYTTVSLGGYGEMLLIGNLILLLTIRIVNEINRVDFRYNLWPWFGLGFLSGFGVWVFGFTLVYSLPAILYLIWFWYRTRKTRKADIANRTWWGTRIRAFKPFNQEEVIIPVGVFGVAAIGGLFGSLPWWAYALRYGLQRMFNELSGGAIAGVESLNQIGQILQHSINLILFGSSVILGLRPPWEIRWLALPLAPFILVLWMGVFIFAGKKIIKELRSNPSDQNFTHSPLLGFVILIVLVGFILTPFGADPSGRYFLPINIVLSIFAAQAIWDWRARFGNIAWIVLSLILVYNFWGILQVRKEHPPGITTQFDAVTQIDHSYDAELIEFLTLNGENWGYTNYWVAYPMAFLSGESVIYLPRLPYHQDLRYTPRDDRYQPYSRIIDQAESTAYITTKNPALDKLIQARLKDLGIEWQETMIGDYHVYFQLSRVVKPEEIGLGVGF
jgi:hypothetical protein